MGNELSLMNRPLIRMAATNHDDPLCRRDLWNWMQEATQLHGRPCLLAVEAQTELLGEVYVQREEFCRVAKSVWAFMPAEMRRELSRGISFEADTHAAVFSDVPVIRLDDGRMTVAGPNSRSPKVAAQELAVTKLTTFKDWLEDIDLGLPPDCSLALAELSRRATVAGIEEKEDPEKAKKLRLREKWSGTPVAMRRDFVWARRIIANLGERDCEWALVVAGARHCDTIRGSLRTLLGGQGRSIEVYWFAG